MGIDAKAPSEIIEREKEDRAGVGLRSGEKNSGLRFWST